MFSSFPPLKTGTTRVRSWIASVVSWDGVVSLLFFAATAVEACGPTALGPTALGQCACAPVCYVYRIVYSCRSSVLSCTCSQNICPTILAGEQFEGLKSALKINHVGSYPNITCYDRFSDQGFWYVSVMQDTNFWEACFKKTSTSPKLLWSRFHRLVLSLIMFNPSHDEL